MENKLQLQLETTIEGYDYGVGRQAKASRRGFLIEREVEKILLTHPMVSKIRKQVFNHKVDEFSQIDLVAELTNGETIYIPINVDLWIGTSQQDRLQANYYKLESGSLKGIHYCYLCYSDVRERLQWLPKSAHNRRGVTITRVLKKLFDNKHIHNIDTLWDYISNVKPV